MGLTDKSIMSFGTHKGKEMQDVPASWLMWFYGQLKDKQNLGIQFNNMEQNMFDYVEDNLDVLKKEIRENQKK